MDDTWQQYILVWWNRKCCIVVIETLSVTWPFAGISLVDGIIPSKHCIGRQMHQVYGETYYIVTTIRDCLFANWELHGESVYWRQGNRRERETHDYMRYCVYMHQCLQVSQYIPIDVNSASRFTHNNIVHSITPWNSVGFHCSLLFPLYRTHFHF